MDVQEETEELMSGEHREKGRLSMETFLIYIKACGYFSFVVLILFNVFL